MRIAWLAVFLFLGACSRAPEHERANPDVAADSAAPGVNVTAAPGVAFAYSYAFRLPPARIAAAQETHAAACEKLGIARCRITGMRYQLVGENDIRAMLAFKLDPALARAFGKTGIAAIEAAEGRLVDAEITGTDAGAAIKSLETGKAGAAEELRRIDSQLARKDLPASERTELQRQRGDVTTRIAQTNVSAAEQHDSLATTPMTFDYQSGDAVRGFDPSAPLKSALDTAIASAQTTLAVLLGFIAIFGPPAIVALLLWLLWRRVRPLLPARRRNEEATNLSS
ncbi:hypothetical protein [Sphingomonas sp. Leaf357]|uniref:hypothetical protein n=1 Tax=Sphingomonas sp. Leaf357 TaxID=1736350 RepID=UPI000A430641|nr:hypothetical protein [Sphingomonas sp. Leaf357]